MDIDEKYLIQEGDIVPFDPEELAPLDNATLTSYKPNGQIENRKKEVKMIRESKELIPVHRIKRITRENTKVTIELLDTDEDIELNFDVEAKARNWVSATRKTERHFIETSIQT